LLAGCLLRGEVFVGSTAAGSGLQEGFPFGLLAPGEDVEGLGGKPGEELADALGVLRQETEDDNLLPVVDDPLVEIPPAGIVRLRVARPGRAKVSNMAGEMRALKSFWSEK